MVLVHFAEGFEEIEALTTVDILRRAEIETLMVSVTERLEVKGAHDISIITDILLEDAPYEKANMIVLPGGMPGTKHLNQHIVLKHLIKEFAQNKRVAAICAAPQILGKMDLLQGKKAVCYPGNEQYLKGAEVLQIPVVTDGNITTGRGAGPASAFALEIVKVLKGEEAAKEVAKKILLD